MIEQRPRSVRPVGSTRRLHPLLPLVFVTVALSSRAEGQTVGPCFTEQFVQYASDPQHEVHFGSAPCIVGKRAFVGAPRRSSSGIHAAGAVYFYEFDVDRWVERQIIVPDHQGQSEYFGAVIDATDELLAAGCPGDSETVFQGGAVDVFRFDGSAWRQTAKLVASDAALEARLGNSVSIHGNRILVGASSDDERATQGGAAYVFRFDGTTWIEEAKLAPPEIREFTYFGRRVVLTDRFAFISAPGMLDPLGTSTGAVFVYERRLGEWTLVDRIYGSERKLGYSFGDSLACFEKHLMIGAPRKWTYFPEVGAVYTYHFDGTRFVETQRLDPPVLRSYDYFGTDIDIDGDLAIVSAPWDSDVAINAGAVYVYRYDGSRWSLVEKLYSDDPTTSIQLGRDLSLESDRFLASASYAGVSGDRPGEFRTFSVPSDDCRAGSVDRAYTDNTADVLSINGDRGICAGGSVVVGIGEPIEIRLDAPPAGPSPAPFALYAWLAAPVPSKDYPQPEGLGSTCLPTFFSAGLPKPSLVWNNAGHVGRLGSPDLPSSPAPTTVVARARGVANPVVVTLQGILADDGSAAQVPASVTNAVVLQIE